MFLARNFVSFWLANIYRFLQVRIEECHNYVHLMYFEISSSCQCDQCPNGRILCNRCKCFFVIHTPSLSVSLCTESCLVNIPILHMEDPTCILPPLGNSTKSQVLCFLIDRISASVATFHFSAISLLIASVKF